MLFDVRRSEGRVALRGFAALLLVVISGHTILEAARDALLLAGPGPRALGLVYMMIAACAWPAAALAAHVSERLGTRRALGASLAAASGLAVLLFATPASHAASVAVYVVSGLVGSIVVPQFWTLVGKALTVEQGRRLFGIIAAAGVLGGVVGSGAAAAALVVLPVRGLLLLSAGVFAVAAAGVLRVRARAGSDRMAPRPAPMPGWSVRALRREPLLSRIAASVVLSTATLLVLDYCFKSAVAAALPSARIGPFLARYYFILNGASLVVQVLLGSAIVRRLGVTRAIVLTPLLLLLGALGVVLGGPAFAPVLLMKAIDGSLRFSVHRITGELVYLPIPLPVRKRLKPFIDGALARASQTVTGGALLAVGGTWLLAPRPLAGVVTLLAVAWAAVAVTMRRPYLGLLRGAISSGSLHAQESPEPLDLESAQLLVQRLASEDPLEVIGAMNALCRRGHMGFVPALVLLHVDENVLTQALDHFGGSERTDWIPLARRLLGHRREAVRVAAARALAMHGALDLDSLAHDVGWRVRGYAAVALALRDRADDALEHEPVATLLREAGADGDSARLGMLAAIVDAPPTAALSRLLLELSEWPRRPSEATDGTWVRRSSNEPAEHTELLARAAAGQRDARLVPALIERLSAREGREAVRSALLAFGDEALDALWWALRNTARSRGARIHIPKTMGRFGTRRAAEHLLESIETEEDGFVRYKSICALELLAAQGRVAVDRVRVERVAQATLVQHFRLLGDRVLLLEDPAGAQGASTAERLLVGLLEDKLRQSVERVFRLLAIAHPREDFRRVRMACLSDDPYLRANAGELLDALLRRRDQQHLRELLQLLTADLPRNERVARAARLAPQRMAHAREDALAALARDRDPILAGLAERCTRDALRSEDRAAAAELAHA
jgi:hypothetical protein